MALDIVLVLAFVLIGGLFSAAEMALVSMRESQVAALAERGRRGERVAKLFADPNRLLATVQVGVTLAGFFAASFGAATISPPLARALEHAGLGSGASDTLAFVLVTIVISYVSLVLGELVPKRLALQRPEGYALLVSGPLDRLGAIFRPLIWALSRTTNLVVRIAGGDPSANRETITEDELRGLVAAHESLTVDERRLIDDVFTAGERSVSEVMIPRTEVTFLDAATPVRLAARETRAYPHSRYPVTGPGGPDDVRGFVHIRDLSLAVDDADATVGSIMRPVTMLPGSKNVLAALSEMRRSGQHLVIVVDEYGGTDGLVTLEDLIEEVIGDIRDEYDVVVGGPGRRLPAGTTGLEGRTNLDDVAELTGLQLPERPYETVAGYVMATLGRIPVVGDAVDVEGYDVRVTEVDGHRVARVEVTAVRPTVEGLPTDHRTSLPPAVDQAGDGSGTAAGDREPAGDGTAESPLTAAGQNRRP